LSRKIKIIDTTTRFGLIRHAMTEWNCHKRIQGKTDTELIGEGIDQAKSWRKLLQAIRWHRIVCSDLRRAKTTADIINNALNLPLIHDHRLREQDWGRWEGETIKALRRHNPQQLKRMEAAGWEFCPPEGEDRLSVLNRSQQALLDAAAKWPGETLLIVCHGGVIKCLLYHLCERQFLPNEPPIIRSYHLHWVQHSSNGLRIEDLNALDLGSPP
jgi:probable phosphoglycerate mutase